MTDTPSAGAAGRFAFPGTSLSVARLGYGAMQLAGAHVFGPMADPEEGRAVLREALALGVDHIDTSDYYGPHVTNALVREALHPYPDGLVIVTKIGAYRDGSGGWIKDHSAAFLRRSVEENLERLGLPAMDIVNMRLFGPEDDVEAPMRALRQMRDEGLVRAIGVSNVTADQVRRARDVAPVACVQNQYNLVQRGDDALVDALAEDGIAYVPFFPLGGFSPIQSAALDAVAADLGRPRQQVALAWLLARSPNMLLIPGTARRAHLRENVAAAGLALDAARRARLDAIAGA